MCRRTSTTSWWTCCRSSVWPAQQQVCPCLTQVWYIQCPTPVSHPRRGSLAPPLCPADQASPSQQRVGRGALTPALCWQTTGPPHLGNESRSAIGVMMATMGVMGRSLPGSHRRPLFAPTPCCTSPCVEAVVPLVASTQGVNVEAVHHPARHGWGHRPELPVCVCFQVLIS